MLIHLLSHIVATVFYACMVRNFKIYSLSDFYVYSTVEINFRGLVGFVPDRLNKVIISIN